jgi:hypothetical protein
MKKILVISVYFGKLPKNFNLWVESCKYNSSVDFLVVTDNKMTSNTKNIKYVYMTFEEFNNLMKEKIGKDFNISSPYKCCDFKPVWGIILEKYAKEYDFWGHCDLDLIFGNIRNFLTDEILSKYDKVLPLGHLSLYRNSEEVNNRYKCEGSKLGTYINVFKDFDNICFDETYGIAQIYDVNDFPFYKSRVFADITIKRKRFTLSRKDKNYRNQVFYWENGHVYRAYETEGSISRDEFVYIHFQKRRHMTHIINEDIHSYFINDSGFFEKENEIPTIEDINKYNCYPGFLYEKIEELKYNFSYYTTRIKKRLKRKKYYNGDFYA